MAAEEIARTVPPLERVVLATDLGADSVDLFAHGLALALRGGARLYLVHILDEDHPEAGWRRLPSVRTLLERWGALSPSATPEQFEALGIFVHPLEFRPIDGDLPTALVRRVASLQPELLLLGTHVRGWFDRVARPSVAEPVVRELRRPTLMLSDHARGLVDPETGLVRLRRVVVPVTSELPQQGLLDELVRLLEALQVGSVQITFIHTGSDKTLPDLSLASHMGWTWKLERREGTVLEQTLEAAAEYEADLIAMVTRGHDTWLDAIYGSTTEQVLHQAPCPVFVFPL
jgi:nucleotide-binding universal stress UspA family protein